MFLGIDTSCYTTSLAVVDGNNNLLADYRRLLDVKKGRLGMAQSEMFFAHSHSFPELLGLLFKEIEAGSLKGIAVSSRPRPQENSYMPVFRAGENMAKVISQSLSLPLFFTSHQEGHIKAAIWSALGGQSPKEGSPELSGFPMAELEAGLGAEFLAVHLSGGTSELLKVKEKAAGFEIEILAQADLAAGQFIDRIGIALGLPFPCGPHLEGLARSSKASLTLPVSQNSGAFYFSGPYTAACRLLERGAPASDLAETVFNCIAQTVCRAVLKAREETGLKQILFCGGVICNKIIRQRIYESLYPHCEVFFADAKYSGDNSIGIALLCGDFMKYKS